MPHEKEIADLLKAVPDLNLSDEWRADTMARLRDLPYRNATERGDAEDDALKLDAPSYPMGFRRFLLYAAASLLLIVFVGGFTAAVIVRYMKSVEELEFTPDHVVLSGNQQVVYLVARNGKTIHAWVSETRGGMKYAAYVPAEMDRMPLAIVGYRAHDATYPGKFVAFEIGPNKDGWNIPLWEIELATSEIPADLLSRPGRKYAGEQFSAVLCKAADVFPDLPGLELVTVFQHESYSQCSLRVYSLNGEMLYQVFHDGNISDLQWLAASKRIACIAANGEAYPHERGMPSSARPHPVAIFAVEPHVGQKEPNWINTVDHHIGVDPIWYRCLVGYPSMIFDFVLGPPHPGLDSKEHFSAVLRPVTPQGDATISITFDSLGNEVASTRILSDGYNRAFQDGLVPDPSIFQFGELPPIKDRAHVWIPGLADTTPHPHQ
jgi:hypothetical protein